MSSSGGAVPPHTMRTGASNFQRPGFFSRLQNAIQTVGTPHGDGYTSVLDQFENAFGINDGAGKNQARRRAWRRKKEGPRRWRGTWV